MTVEALWTPCPALHALPSAFQSFPEALVGDGSPSSSLLVLLMQAWGVYSPQASKIFPCLSALPQQAPVISSCMCIWFFAQQSRYEQPSCMVKVLKARFPPCINDGSREVWIFCLGMQRTNSRDGGGLSLKAWSWWMGASDKQRGRNGSGGRRVTVLRGSVVR